MTLARPADGRAREGMAISIAVRIRMIVAKIRVEEDGLMCASVKDEWLTSEAKMKKLHPQGARPGRSQQRLLLSHFASRLLHKLRQLIMRLLRGELQPQPISGVLDVEVASGGG